MLGPGTSACLLIMGEKGTPGEGTRPTIVNRCFGGAVFRDSDHRPTSTEIPILCPSVVELNRYSYGVVPLRFSLSFCQAASERAKCSRASPPIP